MPCRRSMQTLHRINVTLPVAIFFNKNKTSLLLFYDKLHTQCCISLYSWPVLTLLDICFQWKTPVIPTKSQRITTGRATNDEQATTSAIQCWRRCQLWIFLDYAMILSNPHCSNSVSIKSLLIGLRNVALKSSKGIKAAVGFSSRGDNRLSEFYIVIGPNYGVTNPTLHSTNTKIAF